MTQLQQEQFEAAKQIAFTTTPGTMRRAKVSGVTTNYLGYKDIYGNTWVLADGPEDIDNPDQADRIDGYRGVRVTPAKITNDHTGSPKSISVNTERQVCTNGFTPAMQAQQIERAWQEGTPISTIAYRTAMTVAQVRKHIKGLGHKIQG